MSACKVCTKKRALEAQQQFKKLAVDYKGGKCKNCGYCKCLAAMDFHHRDPIEKEFSISFKNKVFNEDVKKELDKCDLLCANCHREIHYFGWDLNPELSV